MFTKAADYKDKVFGLLTKAPPVVGSSKATVGSPDRLRKLIEDEESSGMKTISAKEVRPLKVNYASDRTMSPLRLK